MSWIKKAMKLIKDAGIELGDKEGELESSLAELEPKAPTTQQTTSTQSQDGSVAPDQLGRIIDEAVKKATGPILQELEEAKKARTAAEEARAKNEETKREEEITQLVADAVKDGRITEEQKESWTDRLKGGFDQVKPILEEMPKNEAIGKTKTKAEEGTTSNGSGADVSGYRKLREDAAAELKAARESQ